MVPFFSIIGSLKSPTGTSLYVNFLGNKSIVFFQRSFNIISCRLSNRKIYPFFPNPLTRSLGPICSSFLNIQCAVLYYVLYLLYGVLYYIQRSYMVFSILTG